MIMYHSRWWNFRFEGNSSSHIEPSLSVFHFQLIQTLPSALVSPGSTGGIQTILISPEALSKHPLTTAAVGTSVSAAHVLTVSQATTPSASTVSTPTSSIASTPVKPAVPMFHMPEVSTLSMCVGKTRITNFV